MDNIVGSTFTMDNKPKFKIAGSTFKHNNKKEPKPFKVEDKFLEALGQHSEFPVQKRKTIKRVVEKEIPKPKYDKFGKILSSRFDEFITEIEQRDGFIVNEGKITEEKTNESEISLPIPSLPKSQPIDFSLPCYAPNRLESGTGNIQLKPSKSPLINYFIQRDFKNNKFNDYKHIILSAIDKLTCAYYFLTDKPDPQNQPKSINDIKYNYHTRENSDNEIIKNLLSEMSKPLVLTSLSLSCNKFIYQTYPQYSHCRIKELQDFYENLTSDELIVIGLTFDQFQEQLKNRSQRQLTLFHILNKS